MRSTSSLDNPEDELMVIFCSLLVARSLAVTLRMPLASISNVTSTCGTPRGAGGMPTSWNTPNRRLSFAMARSPWKTLISTEVWLSAAVENTSLLRVGMVVLRSISFVNTPPSVSIPSDSGVTSSNRTSLTSPPSTPPCTAAPTATTSSGFTPWCGSFRNRSRTIFWTLGVRVDPHPQGPEDRARSEEHTSELQSRSDLVCRLLLEKKTLHGQGLLRLSEIATTPPERPLHLLGTS